MSTRNTRGDKGLAIYIQVSILIMLVLMAFGGSSGYDEPHYIGLSGGEYYIIDLNVHTYFHTYDVHVTNLSITVDSSETLFFEHHDNMQEWLNEQMLQDRQQMDDLINMLTNYCEYQDEFHNQ